MEKDRESGRDTGGWGERTLSCACPDCVSKVYSLARNGGKSATGSLHSRLHGVLHGLSTTVSLVTLVCCEMNRAQMTVCRVSTQGSLFLMQAPCFGVAA